MRPSLLRCRTSVASTGDPDTAERNTYAADVGFLEFDIYYPQDSFGSVQEYVK